METRNPLKIGAVARPMTATHFGLGHGSGAHASDEYFVVDSANAKVQGMDGAVRSFVDYLFQIAAM